MDLTRLANENVQNTTETFVRDLLKVFFSDEDPDEDLFGKDMAKKL